MKILINYRISLFIILFFTISSYSYAAPVDCGGGINGTLPDITVNAALSPSPLNHPGLQINQDMLVQNILALGLILAATQVINHSLHIEFELKQTPL